MATSRSEPLLNLAAALIPCAFNPGLNDSYLLPKLAVASFLTMVVAARVFWRGSVACLKSELDAPIAAFCAVAVLSAAFSVDPRLSWFGSYQDYLFGVFGLAGCVAGYYAGRSAEAQELLRWIVAGSVPVSLIALCQWLQCAAMGLEGRNRILSTFGNPVYLGAYLALVLPLALYVWHCAAGGWSRLGGAALLLALAALVLTESRGAWAAAAAGLGALEALRYWRALKMRTAGFAILAAFVVLLMLGGLWRPPTDRRLSDVARLETWRIAFKEFKEHPWLGSGPDCYLIGFRRMKSDRLSWIYSLRGAQTQAHNDWLQILATMGLAGLVAYAWLHAAILRAAARLLREDRGAAAAIFAALAAVFVQAKFNSPSFGVAFLAAILAGSALASYSAERVRSSLPKTAVVLCLLAVSWSVLCSARAVAADREDRLGTRARRQGFMREAAGHLERAVAFNPENTAYRFDLANLLWDVASEVQNPNHELYLDRAAQVAEQGLNLRPLGADLHRLLGLAELRRAKHGDRGHLRRARRALELSAALDPTFGLTVEGLIQVAELEGDRAARLDAQKRLKSLSTGE